MFVVLLSYIQPLADIDSFVAEHRQFLARYCASGHLLLSGRKEPRTGGVLLVRASSRSEVERIIRDDPFHREHLAQYEIVEFVPSMSAAQLTEYIET